MSRCCVVGGGPAGMVLGLLLARAGVEVTVFEKHHDFIRDFRGDTVHPSTLQLLDELGLGERFASLPQSHLTEMRVRIGKTTIAAADFSRIPGRHKHVAMVPQWDLLDLLADAGRQEPSFTLRMGTEVVGLRVQSGRVRGVRYQGDDGSSGELAADLVVACDGRGSRVREEAGLRPRQFPVPMDVWSISIPRTVDAEKNGRVFAAYEAGFGAVTMDRGDYYQTSYLLKKGHDSRLRAEGLPALRRQLNVLFGWDEDELGALRSWDEVHLLKTEMSRLARWYRDGLLCIGDAAHTMSPVGGMGINFAVQDAVAAARILAAPLREGEVGTPALAQVQRRRWLPTAVAQRAQHAEHETILRPALDGRLTDRPLPTPLRLLRGVPALSWFTAYLGGVGILPEHAPVFARR